MRYIIFILLTSLIVACSSDSKNNFMGESAVAELLDSEKSEQISKAEMILDDAVITHRILLRTTKGDIALGLYGEDAPKTVVNFIGLSKLNLYDGVLIHRIAKNFLIQSGDITTRNPEKKALWGKGGETFYGGLLEDELDESTASFRAGYVPGTVAMANKGPNTNTSQFFICLEDAINLEHKWTIFGRVINGMDVVREISELPVIPSERGEDDGFPVDEVKILSTEIELINQPNLSK